MNVNHHLVSTMELVSTQMVPIHVTAHQVGKMEIVARVSYFGISMSVENDILAK
jgi:hypothetical protein